MQVYFAVALLACVLQAVVLTAKPLDDDISAPEEVAFLRMLAQADKKVAEDGAENRLHSLLCRFRCGSWRNACYKRCVG